VSDGYNLSEVDRQLAGLIRFGVVAELDEAAARVRVSTGGLTTDWLPWLTARASATRTWSAPRVGEQGLVLAQGGDPAQAVFLPGIYQDDFPAPVATKDREHILFPDGSTVDYNSATNTLRVDVAAGGNVIVNCKHVTVNTEDATVNASDHLTVDSPQSTFTGKVTVQGLLTYTAGMMGSGTGPGGKAAQISGPLALVSGAGITTDGGDIVAGAISLQGHTHHETGNETDPPT